MTHLPRRFTLVFLAAVVVQGLQMTPSTLSAQNSCGGRSGSWLSLDQVDLLQTFDKKVAIQPASFSYSVPTGSARSYAINAALRYNFPLNERYTVGPTIEAAANTATAKRQDQLKFGLTGDFQLRDACAKPSWIPFLTVGAERTRDKVKQKDGWLGQVQLTAVPLGRKGGLWYLSNQEFPIMDAASVVLTPYAGLESQSNDSAGVKQSAFRGKASYAANVKPWPRYLAERLTLQASDEIRTDWSRSGTPGDRTTRWFTASADFVLLDEKSPAGETHSASIGVTYQKGANPTQGFERQELTQLLFKIQF